MEIRTAALTVFLFVVSLLILVSSLRANSNSSSKKRRPPGPWAFPLGGQLPPHAHLAATAALRDLAAEHRPVMLLRPGQVVLQASNLSFAPRPSLVASEIFCHDNMVELLSAHKVRQFAPIRDSETMSLVAQIRAAIAAGGLEGEAAVNLGRLLVSCTNSIMGLATFGDGCSGERMFRSCSRKFLVMFHEQDV